MALVGKESVKPSSEGCDITANLPTLQFESALSEEEKHLLVLRKRSHAMTVAACAHAIYFTSICNEARQIAIQLHNPEQRKASRLIQDGVPRDPMKIGIIGCGRLGSHLANSLISYGEVNAEEITVSTRRPETLADLQEKGVMCIQDNRQLVSDCQLVFLCVLPAHLPLVASEIRGNISPKCLIYSFISSMSATRLKQLLGVNNILHPNFLWNKDMMNKSWDYNLDASGIFASPNLVEQTCPLSDNKEECIVWTDEKFAEAMVYAFINKCTLLRISRSDTIDIVNAVIFGESNKAPLETRLTQDDITKLAQKEKMFPLFDLTTMGHRETPLTNALMQRDVRAAFRKRYCDIFALYVQWKSMALQHSRGLRR